MSSSASRIVGLQDSSAVGGHSFYAGCNQDDRTKKHCSVTI